MSSSIIEAKFQQLDRTIKLLSKPNQHPKVASSDQLRQLVYSQRAKYGASKVSSGLNLQTTSQSSTTPSVSLSNQDEPHQQQQQSDFHVKRPSSRPDSSRRRQGRPPSASNNAKRPGGECTWIDPKQQRAMQILEDAWNVRHCSWRTWLVEAVRLMFGLSCVDDGRMVQEIEEATGHCSGNAKRLGSIPTLHEVGATACMFCSTEDTLVDELSPALFPGEKPFRSRLLRDHDEDEVHGVQSQDASQPEQQHVFLSKPGKGLHMSLLAGYT